MNTQAKSRASAHDQHDRPSGHDRSSRHDRPDGQDRSKRARPATIRFLGGAETVTGSRFLLQTGRSAVLFDCGLFQGTKDLRARNWAPFPVDPRSIDAVVITHAHLDHIGYLPTLVHDGFRGSIHATAGTAELAAIVLLDAARLQQEDAAYANRVGSSRHHPAQPLYTAEDAEQTIDRFVVHAFAEQFEPTDDVRVTLHRAGHILGAAWASVTAEGMDELAFSGDLGRPDHPLLLPPDPLTTAGSLVVESTYGNRLHDASARGAGEVLGDVISRTAARGGSVLIPSFAVDRTEVVLYELKRLMDAGDIPALPVYIDSPMALAALRVYRRALDEGWAEIRPELHGREDIFDTGRLNEVRTVAESKSLNDVRFPSIIIAGSGMATGGRILHHLSARLADPRNAVVFVGHQVQGTRGRLLVDGAREIKIFGDYIDVRSEIVDLGGFSVHADAKEVVAWIGTAPKAPRTCFVVHGELDAAEALCGDIRREFASQTIVPKHDEIIHVRQPSR